MNNLGFLVLYAGYMFGCLCFGVMAHEYYHAAVFEQWDSIVIRPLNAEHIVETYGYGRVRETEAFIFGTIILVLTAMLGNYYLLKRLQNET